MPLYEGDTLKEAIQKAVRGRKTLALDDSPQSSPADVDRIRRCRATRQEYERVICVERLSQDRVDIQTQRVENFKEDFLQAYRWVFERISQQLLLSITGIVFQSPDRFDGSADSIRRCRRSLETVYNGFRLQHGENTINTHIPLGVITVPPGEQLTFRNKVSQAKQYLAIFENSSQTLQRYQQELQTATNERERFERSNDLDSCISDREAFLRELQCG